MNVCADLLNYFTGISISSMQGFLDNHGMLVESMNMNCTEKQAINFVVEFALNYATLEVFSATGVPPFVQQQRLELIENAVPSIDEQILLATATRKLENASSSSFEIVEDVAERKVDENEFNQKNLFESMFIPCLKGSNHFALLTSDQISEIHCVLPRYARCQNWELAYSTRKHGIALQTFYGNTGWVGPNIIIVQDSKGVIFGGFSSISWLPMRMYQGTGDTFVYSFKSGKLEAYMWTKKNDYFILAREDSISFGGGGNFALTLTAGFQIGSSGQCTTFGSPCLASAEDFDIYCMECYYMPEICTHESEKTYYKCLDRAFY